MRKVELDTLRELVATEKWSLASKLSQYLSTVSVEEEEPKEEPKGTRTGQQNRGLHLDCKLIAEKLNDAGKDMRVVLKQDVQIPWTTESVKEYIFRPIMKALYQKESTTELSKGSGEIEKIHDVIMRELGEKHGIEWHEFPSDEKKQMENLAGYKIAASEAKEYPEGIDEYTGPTAFG